MKFNELKLEKNILKALKEAGYSEPTPIQQPLKFLRPSFMLY